jgi:hypothetical protein
MIRYGGIIYALFGGLVPLETQRLLQLSTIPIFALSKIPQIWMNFQVNSNEISVTTHTSNSKRALDN